MLICQSDRQYVSFINSSLKHSTNSVLNGSSKSTENPLNSAEKKMAAACFALTKHSKDESGICFFTRAGQIDDWKVRLQCDQDD